MYYSILWLIFFVERVSIIKFLEPNLTRLYGVHSHVRRYVRQSFSCPFCTSTGSTSTCTSGWRKTRVTTPLPAQNLKVVAIPVPFPCFWLRHMLTISIHAGAVGATHNLLLTNRRRDGLFGGQRLHVLLPYHTQMAYHTAPPSNGIEDLLLCLC